MVGQMARIRPDEVSEIAALARLSLSDQELDRMTHDLDAILGYVEALRELNLADVAPMTHAVPFDCPLRADENAPSLDPAAALANAPRRQDNFFEVPRIIAAGGSPAASVAPGSAVPGTPRSGSGGATR